MDRVQLETTQREKADRLWAAMERLGLVERVGEVGFCATVRGEMATDRLLKNMDERLVYVRMLGAGERQLRARLLILMHAVESAINAGRLDELEKLVS